MNIIFFCLKDFYAVQGTTEAYYVHRFLTRRGHSVSAFLPAGASERRSNVHYIRRLPLLPTFLSYNVFVPFALHLRAVRSVDAIYTYKGVFSPVFLLKFIFGKKWVCDFRTSPIAQEVEFRRFKGTLSWGRRLIYRVARLFYRISLKYCDLVVAISDEIRQELVEDYKVPMENVYVQPLGVDLELFKPAHLADEIDGELRLVYIGAIAPQRGLDTVLRAVNLLKGRVPLRLILVGGGEQVSIQNLKILAERLGVSEQVDWVGYIPHDQIPRVLDTCHVALSPLPALQAYQVSSPAKVVEYLAMGKIVIATDIRAHQKLITDGENGLLIPSEDPASLAVAIERIYSDRELRHRLTKNARQSVHAYGWDEMLPKLEERIQALLK